MARILGLFRKLYSFERLFVWCRQVQLLAWIGRRTCEILYRLVLINFCKLQVCSYDPRERYGRRKAVQRADIQQLIKLESVRDEKDVASLRRLCDKVETHYRGLESLGVAEETYSFTVVPLILDLLPEVVRLFITRGKDFIYIPRMASRWLVKTIKERSGTAWRAPWKGTGSRTYEERTGDKRILWEKV